MIVRPATPEDAASLAAIYAHHVLHGTGTFEEAPPTAAEMSRRLQAVQDRGFPWVVVEADAEVVAYAYAAPYRERSAYRYTAEDSVYVAADRQGQGYGRIALAAVVGACRAMGLRRLVAVIGDSRNAGSIALHRSLGFEPCGVLPAVGFKGGEWLDVPLMHLPLNGGSDTLPG